MIATKGWSLRFLTTCLVAWNVQPIASAAVAISEFDRAQFVSALIDESEAETTAEFLAETAAFPALQIRLHALGAKSIFSDARVGYIQAIVPRDQLLKALALPGLEAAALQRSTEKRGFIPLDGRRPAPVPDIKLPVPRVSAQPLSRDGPYYPLGEAGIIALLQQHPGADGRGVTIGFVDDGFDLLHPAIRQVRAPNGSLVAKVLDMEPLSSPSTDNSWVVLGPAQVVREGHVSFAGTDWRVPSGSGWRIGIFAIRRLVASKYDPAREAKTVTLSVGVLADAALSRVWVDTDGDRDFTNNHAQRDYAVAQEIGWFGHLKEGADHRIAFGIKIDSTRNAVWLSLDQNDHGTWTGSAASANRLSGGLFDAPAPGARLIDVRVAGREDLLPAILRAAARDDIDIINRSGGLGRFRPGEGGKEDFQRRVVARAIAVYDKPLLAAGGAPPGAIAIDDYASAEMLRRNRQLVPPYLEMRKASVEYTDEGLVNELLAPSVTLPAVSRIAPAYYTEPNGRRRMSEGILPTAPDGYAVGSNPSCAIAYASGVLADIVSLAKQRNVRYSAERLRSALFMSGKLVPRLPTSVQGRGLIDANGAWNQLASMAGSDDPANSELTRFEVSRTPEGTRVQGYAEEFVTTDHASDRSIWVTRRGGHTKRGYRLALRGDNGTFALAMTSVSLTRDVPTRIDFTVKSQPSLSIAFLRLTDEVTGVAMGEVPLLTKAPERAQSVTPGISRFQAQISPRQRQVRYVDAQANDAQAVHVVLEVPWQAGGFSQTHAVNLGKTSLPMRPPLFSPELDRAVAEAPDHVGPMQRYESAVPADPGLVTMEIGNRGLPEYESPYDPPAPTVPITATLTVKNYAVAFDRTASGRVRMRNRLAVIDGRVEWLSGTATTNAIETTLGFGSASITVPENVAVLRVAVTGLSRTRSAEVFAVNDSGAVPQVQQATQLEGGRAVLNVPNPKAGTWKIAVWERENGNVKRYAVKAIALVGVPTSADFTTFPHDATWEEPFPASAASGDARYAAFRLAPTGRAKTGLLIGLTPLNESAF